MLALTVSGTANAESCSGSGWGSDCSVSNSGTQVDIGGSQSRPGTDDATPSRPGVPEASVPEPDPGPRDCPLNRCDIVYDVVSLPDVTIADLVSFVPARPTLSGEPAGLGVVGMPMNVVAAASAQQIPGVLFDYDVVVRFTPAAFRFSYGDGTQRTSSFGGASWTALRQAEFTPTSTSHVYTSRGQYSVSTTVLYSADVSFGSGWRPVPGYVEATTGGYNVRIVEVRTALVDQTCLENTSGPGC